ncbi:LysR family transcriptional regulator (plasmid) [Azospirillum oryzae]|uniref:LysR family transcriptional regulator n=1 Tax=Azospirillum oryzae TaxID=286727 RepID=A0A6N1AFN0_9PROT|nr:LysR substrate-binding domain-containing protein [Azospirillum oryzae]KAA0587457.1 LysR family transcriptional regulator [Azospirillum oryzae]QKS50485.1 LysR family transcriptional regulator [Azospirillum oryzae]GLR78740.1 LysR family transcriptional regulator [Azospirillum oryzae]
MGKDRLPPLRTLLFFEAAGRLLSFSAAARELACTQSAVSHQIGWLEADLETALFRRLHRGVALTPDGVRLYEATREALDGIGDAVTRIRDRHRPGVLNVATDFGFASGWLLPRLGALRQLLPELDVRVVTTQNAIDLRREAVDIAISFGHGHWPGCEAELLFPERVLPVCSPAFRASRAPFAAGAATGIAASPADLASLPLLHLESIGPAAWLSWSDWFTLHGLPVPAGGHDLTFNNYPLVLQAALMGQGVALGWSPLTDELMRDGHLVALIDRPIQTERGYFLVVSSRRKPDERRDRFRRWVVEESRRDGDHRNGG